MADMRSAVRNGDGVAFLISAGIVYEIIAAACSSPQTTELNAAARSKTLMKWVNIGVVQAVALVAIAAYVEPKHARSIIAGGGIAATLMYAQYAHARRSGLASGERGTESY